MTWVDLCVLGILAVSGLLAFLRGFVREALGIGAWLGAALAAVWAAPYARPRFREWLGAPDLVDPVTYGAVFLAALVVLLLISGWISSLMRMSALGGLDRTLGLVFGLVRGAAVVVFAYIATGLVVPPDRWPEPVLAARSLPLAYAGAQFAVGLLPEAYRPRVVQPPDGREPTEDALLRAAPEGRATASPFARCSELLWLQENGFRRTAWFVRFSRERSTAPTQRRWSRLYTSNTWSTAGWNRSTCAGRR